MIGENLGPILNHKWEKPNSKWLSGKGELIGRILGIQDTGTRADSKISVTGPKKSEVISFLLFILALSPLSSLTVLAWQLSSLRLLHLVKNSRATCPRVLYPEVIYPIRKEAQRHQDSRECSEWPTSDHMSNWRPTILAVPWGPMSGFTWSCGPDPAANMIVNFL